MPEIFAVAGCVLTDERDLLHAASNELPGFGDNGFKTARTEFAAQVGDDAERARMVAALGNFDVSRGARRGQEPRGVFVVEIRGQKMRCALPVVAARTGLGLRGGRLRLASDKRR